MDEFQAWLAYERIEPFADIRADMNAAHMVATMINMWGSGKGKAIGLNECLLKFGGTESKTDDEMQIEAMKITAALGGRIVGHG